MTIVNDFNDEWLNVTNDDTLRMMMKKWLNMAPHDQRVVFSTG